MGLNGALVTFPPDMGRSGWWPQGHSHLLVEWSLGTLLNVFGLTGLLGGGVREKERERL